ncbi:hypothetical protein [Streptomyces nodosus]|uniref:hypothetical protein n=1 Tax=Streptomyces nodosus TaxID=40318 RepID=UPI0038166DAE
MPPTPARPLMPNLETHHGSGPQAFGRFQYPTPPLGRPGGAQAVFHHEWKRAEAKEKLNRTVESFRQYQQGQLPAGPGADALLATFRTIENELEGHDPGPVKVVTVRQSSCC